MMSGDRRSNRRQRIKASITLAPDVYAEAVVVAEARGVALSQLVELALVRQLRAMGIPVPPTLHDV